MTKIIKLATDCVPQRVIVIHITIKKNQKIISNIILNKNTLETKQKKSNKWQPFKFLINLELEHKL